MPVATSIHTFNFWELVGFLLLWIVLVECAHVLVTLVRHGPLIGWAVSPWGVTVMFLHEPSLLYIWLNVLFPACISGVVVYLGLFRTFMPLSLPRTPLVEILVIAGGVLLSSTADFVNALRDMRYPLWGEARILRSIQYLRSSWARIHFTPFGLSYLRDHFGSNPNDLLQAL